RRESDVEIQFVERREHTLLARQQQHVWRNAFQRLASNQRPNHMEIPLLMQRGNAGQLSRSRIKSGTESSARRYSESLQAPRHTLARLAYSTASCRECSSAPELRTSEVICSG